ncbi:MAG TPA: hypothetical protein VF768_05720, partial [Holophagaceae bacterium]
WTGPELEAGARALMRERLHALVQEFPGHHLLLVGAPHDGERPPCPWVGESMDPNLGLAEVTPLRWLGLGGVDPELAGWRDRLVQAGALEGHDEGPALAVLRVSPLDPVILLTHLFRADLALAGGSHPDLQPFREQLVRDVLSVEAAEPHRAAWDLLEQLQAREWLMGLPVLSTARVKRS